MKTAFSKKYGITIEKAYQNAAFCYASGGCRSCRMVIKEIKEGK